MDELDSGSNSGGTVQGCKGVNTYLTSRTSWQCYSVIVQAPKGSSEGAGAAMQEGTDPVWGFGVVVCIGRKSAKFEVEGGEKKQGRFKTCSAAALMVYSFVCQRYQSSIINHFNIMLILISRTQHPVHPHSVAMQVLGTIHISTGPYLSTQGQAPIYSSDECPPLPAYKHPFYPASERAVPPYTSRDGHTCAGQ